MRVLIVGSRTFNDYELLKTSLDNVLREVTDTVEIVSGGANGADRLAERYAKEKGYGLHIVRAEWNLYGKRAGYLRNAKMHEYISGDEKRICVAFWDGISKGTQHSFTLADTYNNPLTVIKF